MTLSTEEFIEHYGKKGMKWGKRNKRPVETQSGTDLLKTLKFKDQAHGPMLSRREGMRDLKRVQKINKNAQKIASKDPTFKREVRATRKRRGITGGSSLEFTKRGELMTGKYLGEFKNSKREKVSVDFANAVIERAHRPKEIKRKAAIGAAFTTAVFLAVKR